MSEIKDYVKSNKLDHPQLYDGSHAVIVFGKPNCRDCDGTKKYLGSKGIDYQYIDAIEHKDALDAIKADNFAAFPVVYVSPGLEGALDSTWAGGVRKDRLELLVRDYVADQGDTWDMA
jgi:glutaredoxin-like protein NrdH